MGGLGRLKTETRGQTMVEFALVAPVLLLLLMAILDFGRVFHAYVTVSTVARETARYAIVRPAEKSVIDKAKDSAVGLNKDKLTLSLAYDGSSRSYDLSAAGSLDTVDAPWNSQPFGSELTVTAAYSCDLLTPLMARLIGSGSIAMASQVVMAME